MPAFTLRRLYQRLLAQHGPQGWWPILDRTSRCCRYHGGAPHDDAERFEIALGAILTQNVAWKNVEKALANLCDAGLLDAARLATATHEAIAGCIRPAGYYNQKTIKIRALLDWLSPVNYRLSSFRGWPTGELRRELLGIHGVGPETADSILLYSLERPVFVIDAYTRRLLYRTGLAGERDSYHHLQEQFHRSIAADVSTYQEYHALIVAHGKDYCAAKPACHVCALRRRCPSAPLFGTPPR